MESLYRHGKYSELDRLLSDNLLLAQGLSNYKHRTKYEDRSGMRNT